MAFILLIFLQSCTLQAFRSIRGHLGHFINVFCVSPLHVCHLVMREPDTSADSRSDINKGFPLVLVDLGAHYVLLHTNQ